MLVVLELGATALTNKVVMETIVVVEILLTKEVVVKVEPDWVIVLVEVAPSPDFVVVLVAVIVEAGRD